MNRRLLLKAFVKAGALSLAAFSMPASAVIGNAISYVTRRVVLSPETDQLGRLYLAAYPEELATCRQLLVKMGCPPARALNIDSDLAQVISQQIRDDFKRGNTVNLRGWLLSRTELRLATLNVI